MYYIIETNYVGPNQDQAMYLDADNIKISLAPAITNSSKEPRIEGWCGTTNDWAVYAHGQYATLDEARAAVVEIFGDVRELGEVLNKNAKNIVMAYKPGKYTPIHQQEDWAFEMVQADISANTTDAELNELAKLYEAKANSEGYTLDLKSLGCFMREHREELQH